MEWGSGNQGASASAPHGGPRLGSGQQMHQHQPMQSSNIYTGVVHTAHQNSSLNSSIVPFESGSTSFNTSSNNQMLNQGQNNNLPSMHMYSSR
jgi:hypothetical protein